MKKFIIIAVLAVFLSGCERAPRGTVVGKTESASYKNNVLYRSCRIEFMTGLFSDTRHVPCDLYDKIKLGDRVNTIELSKEQSIPVEDAK
jgi:hypothetical protein